jgi:peptidoglycan/xylan/chitin deacetylase (PgdA/CDA1 family)
MSRARWVALGAVLVAAGVVLVLVLTGGGRSFVGTDSADRPTGSGSPTPTESAPTTPAPSAPSTSGPTTSPTTPPPTTVPADLRGQDLERIPTGERVVALTFDAGANSDGLASILGTLADRDVPATFFVTGTWAAANPSRLAEIIAAGHRLGNHSMTHPPFTELSAEAIAVEVRDAEAAIRAAGADPRPLFRFPLGDRDARVIAAVNDLGYVAVRWTVDSLGWQGTSGGRSAAEVVDRALGALQPGEIVLMHVGSHPDDGSTLDADALPTMIDRMRAAGYGFTTLDALLTH